MLDATAFAVLFVLTLCYLWFLYLKSDHRRAVNLLSKIPGPKPWPILGNVNELGYLNSATKNFSFLTIFFQTREGLAKIFHESKIMCMWIGRRPVVVVYGAQTVEPILRSNSLLDKGDFYRFLSPWLGDGLLLSKGEKWRRHRKLLTPTFHFRILDNFLTVMNEQSSILVEKLRADSKEKQWTDTFHFLSMCALDIICETAMGIRISAQDNSESNYVEAVKGFLDSMANRGPRPWLKNDIIFSFTEGGKMMANSLKVLHTFTETVIRERMKTRSKQEKHEGDEENSPKKRLAFLDLLLEIGENELTPVEIREQVDTFMFAGHDTTSTALGWVFYLLGLNPEIQERLHKELDEVFQGDKIRQTTQEDLKELKYMDNVMKESQRVYPSVPGFARRLTEDVQIGDYTVPKGTTVAINSYLIHHDPDIYPDPEIFDPERFNLENSAGRSPYAFIPFSAGARNCIGQRYAQMEVKVVMSHVLRNFRVVSLDPRDQLMLKPAAVLRPEGPLRISFIPRD